MAQRSTDARRRKRRIAWLNGTALVVFGAALLYLQLGDPDPGSGAYGVLVLGILVAVAVFVLAIRRTLSPGLKHAVAHGEVLPDADPVELRADLERSRRGFRVGQVFEVVSAVPAVGMVVLGLFLQVWWVAVMGALLATFLFLLARSSARQRRNVRTALTQLDHPRP